MDPAPRPDLLCPCGRMVFEFDTEPIYRCHGCFHSGQACTCPVLAVPIIPDLEEPRPLLSEVC
jgi:hypothetical protein